MRRSIASLLIFFLLCSCLVGGVYANWVYSGSWISTVSGQTNLEMMFWPGLDETPDDTNVGENHMALIEQIVYLGSDNLNISNSVLSNYIKNRVNQNKDTASSVAPVTGGNLSGLFTTQESQLLDFMLHIILDDKKQIVGYDLYTFETALVGKKGDKVGNLVYPIYKTVLVKNEAGLWRPQSTTVGTAKTIYYDAQQGGGKLPTIDPDTFVSGDQR